MSGQERAHENPMIMIRKTKPGKFVALTAFEGGEGEITDEIDLMELLQYVHDRGTDRATTEGLRQNGN